MKYSIKQQIAGIFIAVMVGTIILVWFANSTFLEKYYISNKYTPFIQPMKVWTVP